MDIKIQRIYWTVIILLAGWIAIPTATYAQSSAERISHFDVVAHINQDSTISVEEKITYDFGSNNRHGIFRDIPVVYSNSLGKQTAKITNVHVFDDTDHPYKFTTSKKGNDLEIKIGDANAYVTGTKVYDITYTVSNAIGYFENYDELYWNATGNSWQVPIDAATESIYLPTPVAEAQTQNTCYQGAFGSTERCDSQLEKDASGNVIAAHFTSRALQPGEGLTGALGFPKGIVVQPTQMQKIIQFLLDNAILGLPVIVFIVMFLLWLKKGKDPKGRGTIVAEYEAPDNLTPLEVSALLHQGMRSKDISAEIIYLATLGYLKITKLTEKAFVFSSTDYELTRLKPSESLTHDFDQQLLDGLFGSTITLKDMRATVSTLGVLARFIPENTFEGESDPKNLDIVKLSALKNTFYRKIPGIKKSVLTSEITKGYYPSDPNKIIGKYVASAIVFMLIVWIIAAAGLFTPVVGISFVFSAAIIILFGIFMPKVTEQGAITRERIEGLKLYIKVAEEERIKFHNAPEKNPELFEKLLPYAMIFGLEKEWAKQFEGIYTNPPSWYHDSSGGMFNAVIFTNNLSSFSSAATATLGTAPGGHSGSGGGGFSGGGGGGGGGGSW